jgi:hypothetical protein
VYGDAVTIPVSGVTAPLRIFLTDAFFIVPGG